MYTEMLLFAFNFQGSTIYAAVYSSSNIPLGLMNKLCYAMEVVLFPL
jgi:hypothetical protein